MVLSVFQRYRESIAVAYASLEPTGFDYRQHCSDDASPKVDLISENECPEEILGGSMCHMNLAFLQYGGCKTKPCFYSPFKH